MIKNCELVCILFLLNYYFIVDSQGYPLQDAPKVQRTPQNTGCLNYGHSCLGAHGKRSRAIRPKLTMPQFVPSLDASLSSEDTGNYSPERYPYDNRISLLKPSSYGYFPYVLPSTVFNFPSANSYSESDLGNENNEADFNGQFWMKNLNAENALSLQDWGKLLIANSELMRSPRAIPGEADTTLNEKDAERTTKYSPPFKTLGLKDSKYPADKSYGEYLEGDN